MKHISHRFGDRLACFFVCLFLFASPAARGFAAGPRDITANCLIDAWSNKIKEKYLFDSEPRTAWYSTHKNRHYLQVYKPTGIATLSVLWADSVHDLELQYNAGDGFETLEHIGSLNPLPETFVLPEAAGAYRLWSTQSLSIAELRVHEGVVEDFFGGLGYPPSPTSKYTAQAKASPTQRQKNGPGVREMLTRLTELGYYDRKIGDVFDDYGYLAMLDFQRAHGIYANGTLDLATSSALYAPDALPNRTMIDPDFDPEQRPLSDTGEKMPRLASTFVDFIRSKVGHGYVYGASGQLSSPDVRGIYAKLYPEYTEQIRGVCKKWDGLEVYDCVGLIKAFLALSTGEYPKAWRTNVNGAATRWMVEIGPIDTMPRQPGIILLQQNHTNENSFMHMGVYVGDGMSVHARGHNYGVVEDPMPQLWTHWARPSWLAFDVPEEPATPWPAYMGRGDRVLVDTGTGLAMNLYSKPMEDLQYLVPGVQISNHTELTIKDVPTMRYSQYWRVISVRNHEGKLVTGYVYAKDLTPLRPECTPVQLRPPMAN